MKSELFIIQDILATNNVECVLDIGAGKWYASLFCASYGAQIDAVDDGSMASFWFPKILENHPKIDFHDVDIAAFHFPRTYNLVLMTNVIMFLDKELFFDTLFPKILASLSKGGHIVLSFFLSNDQWLKEEMNLYDLKDFTLPWISVVKSFDSTFQEDHPPQGLHMHHVQYLVLKKI